jgi:thiosulfate/3-mercaptopyruvate sulfurtransferase
MKSKKPITLKHKILLFTILLFVLPAILGSFIPRSVGEPWRSDQLMDPAELARIINDPHAHQPVLLSIGPAAVIKNSVDIGPTQDRVNLERLRVELENLSRQSDIVIYCGCCPFKNCPNIRPAFRLLNEMKFERHKLLNLSRNIKMDWIDKGYPVTED